MKKRLYITLLVAVPIMVFVVGYTLRSNASPPVVSGDLPVMKEIELKNFDGSDPAKPIYIGMNGFVYDVTGGSKYYRSGGVYHFLAGKDSSVELNAFGGDIIRKKYPVIAHLER